jgi:hypothetical protein
VDDNNDEDDDDGPALVAWERRWQEFGETVATNTSSHRGARCEIGMSHFRSNWGEVLLQLGLNVFDRHTMFHVVLFSVHSTKRNHRLELPHPANCFVSGRAPILFLFGNNVSLRIADLADTPSVRFDDLTHRGAVYTLPTVKDGTNFTVLLENNEPVPQTGTLVFSGMLIRMAQLTPSTTPTPPAAAVAVVVDLDDPMLPRP